jgi:hypothetical protein
MGSIKHPKLLSVDQMEGISEAFHEIWDTIHGQNVFLPVLADDELRAEIIKQLLTLATEGTPPGELKSKVLKTLPFL